MTKEDLNDFFDDQIQNAFSELLQTQEYKDRSAELAEARQQLRENLTSEQEKDFMMYMDCVAAETALTEKCFYRAGFRDGYDLPKLLSGSLGA